MSYHRLEIQKGDKLSDMPFGLPDGWRIGVNEDGSFDELVAKGELVFHIEQMNDGHWWMSVTDGTHDVHINLSTQRRPIFANVRNETPDDCYELLDPNR